MRTRILRIGAGSITPHGIHGEIHTSTSIHAEQRASVPGSYGRLVAGDSGSLWFEDTASTLRQVNVLEGKTIF